VDCLAASIPKSITATVGDAVCAKLAELDLGEQDIADALAWARQPTAGSTWLNRNVQIF